MQKNNIEETQRDIIMAQRLGIPEPNKTYIKLINAVFDKLFEHDNDVQKTLETFDPIRFFAKKNQYQKIDTETQSEDFTRGVIWTISQLLDKYELVHTSVYQKKQNAKTLKSLYKQIKNNPNLFKALLANPNISQKELAQMITIAQNNVSIHLVKAESGGLVTSHRDGLIKRYNMTLLGETLTKELLGILPEAPLLINQQ